MADLFRFLRRSPEDGDREREAAPGDERELRRKSIRAYHAATCHHLQRYAHGPEDLDWDTQPDPFRRYHGAPLLALAHFQAEDAARAPRYADVFVPGSVEPARVDRMSISRLFHDSLALSAWKQSGESRWSLRVNPSSGNLHPTEAYLLCGAIAELCEVPMLAHYAPREHALEVRAQLPPDLWDDLSRALPPGSFAIGLTSIHWREAWKYGERAYRYCQLDAGHAIACIATAAAGLGWSVRLCDDLAHEDLECLLGVADARDAEREDPHCLLIVTPDRSPRAQVTLAATSFAPLALAGEPNSLSPDHVEWSAVDAAAQASRKPRTSGVYAAERVVPEPPCVPADARAALRQLVHQRRSAVDFDGRTELSRENFYNVLASTLGGPARCLPWAPRVHCALFVHRVRGLDPGLYFLARDAEQTPLVQAAMQKPFAWQRPQDCSHGLELFQLAQGDVRSLARSVSCHQNIAADGCFAVSMLTEFEPALARYGAWFYPRLFWECGVVGQALYLAAESVGIRATGIGCFFDEATHAAFGISTLRFRSLYHFTMGGPVSDARLQTWPPYPPRDTEPEPARFLSP